jgi:hypothetical protein
MGHLVRRDRDCCHRTPVVMLRQQPHGARCRVVMVASISDLDLDVGQLGFVEQMTGELAACARKVRSIGAVLLEHAPDPPCRTKHKREHQEYADSG